MQSIFKGRFTKTWSEDMKLDLQYRENDYFNTEDVYLCYDHGLMRFLLTKIEPIGAVWFCKEKLRYKCTSVIMVNTNELIGQEISLKGIEYTGKLVKVLYPDNFGIIWNSGPQIKKHGLQHFWTEWYKLELNISNDNSI